MKIDFEPRDIPAYSLAFRASWHLRKQIRTRLFSEFRVLNARGPGHYVGCCLSIANPSKIWWREGDEKFFVDGESFPSTFGTGTEDYFGYAFADTDPFESAYHAQPQCDGPDNSGYTCLDRFHLHDSVPFQESFLFDLEIWHWRDVFVDYATTAYWYGPPQASSGLPFVPGHEYRKVDEVVPERFFEAENALEGELATCIRAGKVDDTTPITAVDLLPTFREIAQVQLPEGYKPDGVSQLPALLGKPGSKRAKPIFWQWKTARSRGDNWPTLAVRQGQWKLLLGKQEGQVELFRFPEDRLERTNLREKHADEVRRLKALIDAWKETLPEGPNQSCFSEKRDE